jgi:acetaldehyde dehydrogenase (acetylating)
MDPDLASIQEARDLVERAYEASRRFLAFSQEQVDAIVDAMAQAATAAAEDLAREAVEETGYGVFADKVQKNLLCSRDLHQAIRAMKTVGVLREDRQARVLEVALPVGVVIALTPTTNPTSTAIYKSLIALKGGNAVVISPHPNAVRCTCHTADVLYRAARAAGAPEHAIGCLHHPTRAAINELMKHRHSGVILATGGSGLVRAAYSSGKPAFGVGPGNVPAFIERSGEVRKAVADVVRGTTFDNGTVCSSEQAIVAEEPLREQVLAELRAQGAYILNEAEIRKLGGVLVTPEGTVNPKCVGQSAVAVAQTAGLSVPPNTRVLIAPLRGVGKEHPLSAEKLSPVLALYFVKDFEEGCQVCESLLRFGGLGHTVAIHSRDDGRIREFGLRMPACRVIVNSPAPHGSVGYSTGLLPAMTLGCGALGGNSTGDNISPLHLINTKRIAYETRPVEEQATRAGAPLAAASLPAGQAGIPAPPARVSFPAGGDASASSAHVALPDRQTIQSVVARFLASQGARPEAAPAGARAPGPAAERASSGPLSPASSPKVVDFVCENDVRAALNAQGKIHIGPRTIVTPSARDLAAGTDVFIIGQAK